MRRVIACLALVGAGCSSPTASFPTSDGKYKACLETELKRAGYHYEVLDPPTPWGESVGAINWQPPSNEIEQRVWCEAAFCVTETRDVTKFAFPDMCKAYQ